MLFVRIDQAYKKKTWAEKHIHPPCSSDLTVMALAAGKQPHFTTIADFVSGYTDVMNTLFHNVLMICCQSGLVGREHFAIDGCKLPSDASKQWSGTHLYQEKSDVKIVPHKGVSIQQQSADLNILRMGQNRARYRAMEFYVVCNNSQLSHHSSFG